MGVTSKRTNVSCSGSFLRMSAAMLSDLAICCIVIVIDGAKLFC
jgi:hypothetical protein